MLARLLKHRLVKDILILFGVQVTGYLLPLITLPYLARVLGPQNFGLIALGTALVLYFAVIVEYGFAVNGTRQIAIVQDNPEQVSRVYSTVMACKIGLMLLCLAALLGLLAAVPPLRQYGPLYGLSFLQVVGWGLSPNWFLQGMQRMRLIAVSDYGAKIISVALIFLLVHKSSDYLRAAALQSGGFLMSAAIGLTLSFFMVRVRLVRPAWKDIKAAMKDGFPVFLSNASMTVMTSSNTMILGSLTSPAEVGYFSGASRLIITARALTNPVTMAVYPHMSKLASRSRHEGVLFLKRQLFWTAAPFLALSIAMLLSAPLAIRILYGPAYAESAVLLRIMSMTPFVHAVSMCFGTYFMLAFGYEKEWTRIITRMVVLNFIVLGILLFLMRPVRAVALTTTLTDLFTATSCGLFYRRTVSQVKAAEEQVPSGD